ncbi:MAG: FG-GAP repeat domain-containing protein [Myxococcales bacterium]
MPWGLESWLLVAALASPGAIALSDEMTAPPAWGACPERAEGAHTRPYLLGRYEHGVAVLEADVSGSARLAHLWAHAASGGTEIGWPGGRPGVRHLTDPKQFGEAAVAARAGRIYLWTSANGWNGGDAEAITSIELAKSLCDARDLVVYLVTKAPQGAGFVLGTPIPPPESADAPPADPPDTPRAVMNRIYSTAVAALEKGVRSQKLTPASLAVNVFPGHFDAAAPQYAVSLRWGNAFDDRFSLLYLADKDGALTRLVDQQEGGAGGTLVEVADVNGDGYLELFYQVTTLDGSAAALWSLKNGKIHALVQTTPVGE